MLRLLWIKAFITNNFLMDCIIKFPNQEIFFHLLARKPKLEKISIYLNKLFHNVHLSESGFTCPRLRVSGLVWRLLMWSRLVKSYKGFWITTSIFGYMETWIIKYYKEISVILKRKCCLIKFHYRIIILLLFWKYDMVKTKSECEKLKKINYEIRIHVEG